MLYEVIMGLHAALKRDEHQAALVGEALQFARNVVAADHVENHIDALAAGRRLDLGDEILRTVVDRGVRASYNFV